MTAKYHGIYPMLYAFYNRDGSLDRGAMKAQVNMAVRAGCQGVAVLGIVSEVAKQDVNERRLFVDLVAELVAGRCRYAVTVAEPSVRGQVEFAKASRAAGADWIILQLPAIKGASEGDFVRFLGEVADGIDTTVAIQNNPVNMDVSVSNEALLSVHRDHPNVGILKAEGPAVTVAPLAAQKSLAVFGGRNGIELIANLRSGCVGNIPAPELAGPLVRVYELARSGRPEDLDAAEELHQQILPLIVFIGQNLQTQICYGKRCVADQIGLSEIQYRIPGMTPTEFGLETLRRLHARVQHHLDAHQAHA